MFFDFLFCCSNSTLKENKAITFEKLNSNEEMSNHNEIIDISVNMEYSQAISNNDNNDKSNDKINNIEINNNNSNIHNSSINYNINNINHLVNNINHINVFNNSNYYSRERSNKLEKNKTPHINTIISNKSSFKSLLIQNYNNQNNLNINSLNKHRNNININNYQNNNNNNLHKKNSFLSFSNLIVTKNTKTHMNDDTEILSPYELLLSGEIFYNKEIKIDRLGIKSNKIGDKKIRKEHLIKFGVLINEKHRDSDFNTSDIKSKIESEMQNKIDINSLSSSFQIKGKDHNLDMILNIERDKITKLLDIYEHIIAKENEDEENLSSPKIRKENKSITLFTIRYIASMELFEFCSVHKSIPIELLLDHEYQLRSGYDYNIKLGEVWVILKILKNINDEDILKVKIIYNNDKKLDEDNPNNNKKEEFYSFNSSNDINKYISIGNNNCTININNDSVSSTHLKIRYSDNTDTFSVIDGGSKNGSYLLLNEPFNFLYIKNILSFRLLDSKFNIKFMQNNE